MTERLGLQSGINCGFTTKDICIFSLPYFAVRARGMGFGKTLRGTRGFRSRGSLDDLGRTAGSLQATAAILIRIMLTDCG